MVDLMRQKKIITFIFLKVIEIGGLCGATLGPYFLGKYLNRYELTSLSTNNWLNGFFNILFVLLLLILIGSIIWGIYLILAGFIKLNWKWACMLNETPSERNKRELAINRKIKEKEKEKGKIARENYGYAQGDRVKIVKAITTAEKLLKGKVMKVKNVGWWGVTVEGSGCMFYDIL